MASCSGEKILRQLPGAASYPLRPNRAGGKINHIVRLTAEAVTGGQPSCWMFVIVEGTAGHPIPAPCHLCNISTSLPCGDRLLHRSNTFDFLTSRQRKRHLVSAENQMPHNSIIVFLSPERSAPHVPSVPGYPGRRRPACLSP